MVRITLTNEWQLVTTVPSLIQFYGQACHIFIGGAPSLTDTDNYFSIKNLDFWENAAPLPVYMKTKRATVGYVVVKNV